MFEVGVQSAERIYILGSKYNTNEIYQFIILIDYRHNEHFINYFREEYLCLPPYISQGMHMVLLVNDHGVFIICIPLNGYIYRNG